VDVVLLDLGAGSAFNVLDLFLLAQRGRRGATPEPTAIENAEHFLRAAVYRSLRFVARQPEVNAAIVRTAREPSQAARALGAGADRARARDRPAAAKPLEDSAKAFAPMLIVNQVQSVEHRRTGPGPRRVVPRPARRLDRARGRTRQRSERARGGRAAAARGPGVSAVPFSRQIEGLARRLLHQPSDRRARRSAASRRRARCVWSRRRRVAARACPRSRHSTSPSRAPICKRCREALGLTLTEMTERTRIRGLDHLESERFERLPAELYLKSYLTTYARELGVRDVEALAASYLGKCRNHLRCDDRAREPIDTALLVALLLAALASSAGAGEPEDHLDRLRSGRRDSAGHTCDGGDHSPPLAWSGVPRPRRASR
jgi:hypothetical protein